MALALKRATGILRRTIPALGCALAMFAFAPTGSRADVWDWLTGVVQDNPDVENAALSGIDLPPDAIVTGAGERRPIQLGRDLIELYPATAVTFEVNGEKTTVRVLRGTIRATVAKRTKQEKFAVETADLVATVKGTDFEVSAMGQASAISVYEGRVAVKVVGKIGGLDVTPGKTATVAGGDHQPRLDKTPPGGAAAAALSRAGKHRSAKPDDEPDSDEERNPSGTRDANVSGGSSRSSNDSSSGPGTGSGSGTNSGDGESGESGEGGSEGSDGEGGEGGDDSGEGSEGGEGGDDDSGEGSDGEDGDDD